MNAIEVRELRKTFRTYRKQSGLMGALKGLFHREYNQTHAVDGVTFEIPQGELVGFLGPNGAGKTTVLKTLSGLLNPTSGQATVLGFTPWQRKDAMKRQISLLMGQKNALWWDLPARESLELNRAIYEIPRSDFTNIVKELTELLDVGHKLDVMVRELSLGERMKMELIAALLHRPKVLFLDEPTIGLDVMSQKTVREFLKRHNTEAGTTIILTSHYMQDIEELCRRVMLIDHGKLFFDGPLDTVIERFSIAKVIEVDFAAPVAADFSRFGVVLEQASTRLRIEVPRSKVAEVCREILTTSNVSDFAVQEVPIEEVIRRVFKEQ